MKQKNFGQKVLNWHRPLHPSALGQRYRRRRQQVNLEDYWDDWYDWDAWDDDPYWWCNCCDPNEDPYVDYKLAELLSRITTPLNPLLGLKGIAISRPDSSSDASCWAFNRGRSNGIPLEKRLAEHVKSVLGCWGTAEAIRYRIIESIGDSRNLHAMNRVADKLQSPGLVKLLCFFSPFWVRSPMTWKENSEVSLLDHVFVLYDVPDFLHAEWRRQAESEAPVIKWLCWFILLAQGGSLKRAASYFNWNIPNRFQHSLQAVPSDLSPTEACIFAEAIRLGGDENDYRRIRGYEAFAIDPTAGRDNNASGNYWDETVAIDTDFWRETVHWLIANREAITDENIFPILSWAMHSYTEAQRCQEHFSWKGRGAHAVIDRSLEYRRQTEQPWENYNWFGQGWDWTLEDARSGNWSFSELTSSEELFHEGKAMNHCVYTYGARCASGASAIVSIKCNDQRRLTVEINPAAKIAVQIRGPFNRSPHPDEMKAVMSWMNAVVRSRTPDPTI